VGLVVEGRCRGQRCSVVHGQLAGALSVRDEISRLISHKPGIGWLTSARCSLSNAGTRDSAKKPR